MNADWAKLDTMVETLSDPKSFVFVAGKNILINGVDILHHIERARTDYLEKVWDSFGEQIGILLAEVVFGKDDENLFLF